MQIRQQPGAARDLSGVRVMIVDDSNTIRKSAQIFLQQAGCQVILAENGFDALGKVHLERPDLIFVDVVMPRLNGYQFCSLVKKNSSLRHTPLVMLSSKDDVFDRVRGRSAGSEEHVSKPFTKENLLRAVGENLPV